MNKIKRVFLSIIVLICLPLTLQANPIITEAMFENDFVKMFSGKDAKFVREHLGEPLKISSKNNESGTVEFWLYKDIVRMGDKDKTFQFTQIGIINGHIETLGNSNRVPQ
jgi:hypothetical protein